MKKSSLMVAAMAVSTIALMNSSASANTLTRLIPDLYAGMDVVSRELVGMIPSVMRNSSAERAALNEPIVYHIAPAATATDNTQAMTVPEPADQTIGNDIMTISKSRNVAFGYVGEEQKGLNNGPGFLSVQADQFAQALRTLVNEIEVDLWTAGALGASRAYGIAGTTPFGSNLGDAAQVRKILDDNGCPASERSLVINTAAGASLRTLAQLTKANEAGTTLTLRQGELLDIHNLSVKESAGVNTRAVGTAASATTNNAGYAVGATTIILASAGTGTIIAGDLVTFAGDTNKYQVVTGDADVSGGGTIVLAAPGLRVAIPAAATNITVVALAVRNLAFCRSAIHLVTRAPAMPKGGDIASETMMLTDPRSGLTFEVRVYKGYGKVRYQVGAAWGVKAVKTPHIAALLG